MANSKFNPAKAQATSQNDFEVVGGSTLPPDLAKLRHLGFRQILLAQNKEHSSFGPSYFHQLGYCARGSVLLTVFGELLPRQIFELQKGDIFFLPAGCQYILENSSNEAAVLVVASARHRFDVLNHVEDVLSEAIPDHASTGPLVELGTTTTVGHPGRRQLHPAWDVEDDSPHVVLFFDPPGSKVYGEDTIAALFCRDVLAREFGMPQAALPDLDYGLYDALVIRPIASDARTHN